jgi:hypothetical protein
MPGGSPTWQLFRVAYRASKQPLDGLALLSGYCSAAIRWIKTTGNSQFDSLSSWEAIEKAARHFEISFKIQEDRQFFAADGAKVIRGHPQGTGTGIR